MAVKNGIPPASGADGIGYGSPFFGVSLVHTSDTVVTVTPNTDLPFDGKGRVLMYDTSEVGKWFTISSNIAIDNTTEGPTANGRRNGLTIGNNLPYPIYLYGKEDGTVCGQYLGTGENPTSYFPTGYTYVSPCMGAVCSDGTADWIPFWHLGNKFYLGPKVSLVAGGKATTPTAVDFSTCVPDEASSAFGFVVGYSSSHTRLILYTDSGGSNTILSWEVGGSYFSHARGDFVFFPMHATTATSIYYKWDGTPNTGAYISCSGFEMRY